MKKSNNFRVNAVFFDLDGTLLDTAPDLANALNQLLKKYGRSPLPLEIIRPTVAEGTQSILCNGFNITIDDPMYANLRTEYLTTYANCFTQQTDFFPEIENVLFYLDHHHIPWGIVTNKPQWLAEPLLKHFKLHHRYRCLVAGDLLPQRKPHPAPLQHACHLTQVSPQDAVYIGDTTTDVCAAKAAGMIAIVAKYGYLSKNSQPDLWNADMLIDSPKEIISWLTAS